MKKTGKFIAISAALLLCTMIFAGCSGGGSGTEINYETNASAGTTAETETSSETEAAEETVSEDKEEEISEYAEIADDEEDHAEPVELPPEQTAENVSDEIAVEIDYLIEQAGFTLAADENNEFIVNAAREEIAVLFDRLVNGQSTADLPHGIEGVKLNSWTVKDEKFYEDRYRYEVTVTLDIAESESEFMPVGKADYLLVYSPGEARVFLPLRKVGEFDESRLLPGDTAKEYVNFCTYYTAYFGDFFSGDTVTDFSAPKINEDVINNTVFNAYVAASRGGGFQDIDTGIIPYSEYSETLEKILGFSADAINAKSCMWYNADTDSIEIPGRGTGWICGWLAEDIEGEEENTRVVTIDYFEDDFYLVKSQTYRYTLRINDDGTCSMLKIEHLYKSDRGILSGSV